MQGSYRNWLVAAVIALVGLVAAALVAQSYGRAIRNDPYRAPPQVQIQNQAKQLTADRSEVTVPDPDVGFTLQPGLMQYVVTDDFSFLRTTDAYGFPNAAWPERADIVFLGDSLIVGEGVGHQNGFVARIDAALPGATVVNLGLPGAGPARQSRIYDKFGASLDPALIVSVICVSSDLVNDVHFLAWLDDPEDLEYERFRLGYSRRRDEPNGKDFLQRLQGHVLYELGRSIVEPRLWGDRQIPHRMMLPDGTEQLLQRKAVLFARAQFEGTEPEFQGLQRSLDYLVAQSTAAGRDLLVVLMPSKEELFAAEASSRSDSAVSVVRQELRRRAIDYLDLYPVLLESARKQAPFFKRDPHLNESGNRVVADAFLDWLRDNEPP